MAAPENIETVRVYAHNQALARTFQQMLKMARDDIEPEYKKQQDMLDKQIAARMAQIITGFGP